MSREIDERVVEMEFDNKQFEKGAKESLSTLDKLKDALDFSGASKSLSELDREGRNFTFGGMGGVLDNINGKFSTMDIVAISAIQNITNSAINMGEQLVKSLSFDQISAGFSKYEDKTKSVQTIMNATGKSIEYVNEQLDKLNWYTDETSYNFVDMTNNIGKFTSAGVDLDVAVTAMEGIANWAALSGQGANEASRAMYNLSQALGIGAVKLQDWKSIVYANMATKEFKEIVIDTAKEVGTLNDLAETASGTIVSAANFDSTLSEGWFSSDVLIATLQRYGNFADAVYDLTEEQGITAAEAIEALGKDYDELGYRAFTAAQQAKSFSEAIEATKDAVSSGWLNTFEIIFGDYVEAAELWTDLSVALWDIFAAGGEARNELLTEGLSTGWKQMIDVGVGNADNFKIVIQEVAKAHGLAIDEMLADYDTWEDSLQSGWLTADILSDTIYLLADSLSILDEEQLDSVGYTQKQADQVIALAESIRDGSVSVDELAAKMAMPSGRQNLIDSFWNLGDAISSVITPLKEGWDEVFGSMTGDQLYSITESIRDFTASLSLSEEQMTKLQQAARGVALVINGIISIIRVLVGYLTTIAGTLLPPIIDVVLDVANALGSFIEEVNGSLKPFNSLSDIVDNLATIFGKFADALSPGITEFFRDADDFLSKLIPGFSNFSGAIKNAIATTRKLKTNGSLAEDAFGDLNSTGEEALTFTQRLENLILTIQSSTKPINTLGDVFDNLVTVIHAAITTILPGFDAFVAGVKEFGANAKESISTWSLDLSFDNIGKNITALIGKITGLNKIADKNMPAFQALVAGVALKVNQAFKSIEDSGKTLMSAVEAVTSTFSKCIQSLWNDIAPTLENLTFKQLIAGIETVFGVMLFGYFTRLVKSISDIVAGFAGLGAKLSAKVDQIADSIKKSIKKITSAAARKADSEALLTMATSIAVLVGSLIVLSMVPTEKLGEAAAVLAILAVGLLVFATAFAKSFKLISEGLQSSTIASFAAIMASFAIVIASMAKTMKTLSDLNNDQLLHGVLGIAAIVAMLDGTMAAVGHMFKGQDSKKALAGLASLSSLGIAVSKLASSIVSLSAVTDEDALWRAYSIVGTLVVLLGALMTYCKSQINGQTALALMGLSVSVGMLVGVMELVGLLCNLSLGTVESGLLAVGAILVELGVFMGLAAKFSDGAKLGASFLSIGAGVMALSASVMILGNYFQTNPMGMLAGLAAVATVLVELAGFTNLTKSLDLISTAAGLAILSASLIVMAQAVSMFGNIPIDILEQGLEAVLDIVLVFTLFTNLVKPVTAMAIAVSLVAFAAAVAVVSAAIQNLATALTGEQMKNSCAALLSVIAGLVAAFALINASSIVTAAAFAVTLGTIAASIMVLSGLKLDQLVIGLAAIVVPLATFAGLAILLSPMAAALTAIAVPLAAIGVAALAVSAALSLLVFTFTECGYSIEEGGQQLIVFLGEAVDGFLEWLITLLPKVGEWLMEALSIALDTALTWVPKVVQQLGDVVYGLLMWIVQAIVGIPEVIYDFYLEFLDWLNSLDIVKLGNSIIDDFVKGITKGLSGAWQGIKTTAANAASSIVTGFCEALGINSPSKVAAEIGGYFDAGIIQGLLDGASSVSDAAAGVGDLVDESAKDALKINSPSEEGEYIGQMFDEGVANGVTDNESVIEDAGASASGGLINSFVNGLSSGWHKVTGAIKNTVGSSDIVDALGNTVSTSADALLEKVTGGDSNGTTSILQNMFGLDSLQETLDDLTSGLGSGTSSGASSAGKSAASGISSTAEKVTQAYDDAISLIESRITSKESSYNLWEATLGLNATETEKTEKNIELLTDKIDYQTQIVEQAEKRYNAAAKEYGEDSKDTIDQYNNWLSEQVELAELQEELSETQDSIYDSVISEYEEQQEIAAAEYTYWTNTNKLASKSEKTAKEIENVNNQLNIQSKIVEAAKEKYDKAVAKYGKSSQEARDALNDWTDAMDAELELETEAAELSGEIAGDIQTAYDSVIDKIQESADFAESRYELLSDILEEFQDVAEEVSETMEADTLSGSTIADLEYNLWALSDGRNATEEEIIEKKSEALQKDIEEEEDEVAELQAAYDALVADQSSTEVTDNEDVIDAYKSWLSTDEGKAATETEKQAKYQELLSDAVDDAYSSLLQEQISLQELKNDLEDLTEEEDEETETTAELASKYLDVAYNAFVAANYVQKLTTSLKAYNAAIASGDYDAAEAIQEDMIELQSGMNSAISTALDTLDIDGPVRGVVELVATAFTTNWSGVSDTVTNLFGSLFNAVTTGDWAGTLTSNLGNIFSLFTQSSDSASIFTGTLNTLGSTISGMTSESGSLGILQTILSSFTGESGLLQQIISACTSLGSEGGVISGLIDTLSGFVGSSGVLSSIASAISGFIGSSGLLSALAGGFASCAGVIIAAIDSLLASIPVIGWIALAIGAIVGVVAAVSNKSTDALDEALEQMEEITEAADDLNTTATVSVVVDLSSLEDAEDELDDTDWEDWEIGTSSSSSYDSASSATSAASSATSSSSSSATGTSTLIYTQVQRIANRLDSIETTISEMQVVLDTGVLVGELASGIDETLGSYATYSSRGN